MAGDRERELDEEVAEAIEAITHDRTSQSGYLSPAQIAKLPAAERLLNRPREEQVEVALALVRAMGVTGPRKFFRPIVRDLFSGLTRRKLPWTPERIDDLLGGLVALADHHDEGRRLHSDLDAVTAALKPVEKVARDDGLSDDSNPKLREMRRLLLTDWANAHDRDAAQRIGVLLGEVEEFGPLGRNDNPWAQAINERWQDMDAGDQDDAGRLLRLAAQATSAQPSDAFRGEANDLCDQIGRDRAGRMAGDLLTAAAEVPGSAERGTIPPELGDVLRGIAWIAGIAGGPDAARGLGAMGVAGWKKVPSHGPLSQKAGNACIAALAELPEGAPQLGRLRSLVKQKAAVKKVEEAIDSAAESMGVERSEFEETVVPDFGLDDTGSRREELGDHVAEISFDDRFAPRLRFFASGKDKPLKSVPAAVRKEHKDRLDELRAEVKELTGMTRAQRIRLERLLLGEREWRYADWRERYPDHGLVGVLARRLIWVVDGRPAILVDDQLTTSSGDAVNGPNDDAPVALWHPVDSSTDDVRAWRVFLEEREIRQPFKQAHREIYLLTDAERETRVYSNRFAAHLLKQHQMAALAHERGWTYALQGAWDAPDEQAMLGVPELTASFYVDRPWDAVDWETFVADSGAFLYVVTDQVRFGADAGSVPLDDVPVRVFSEVMRDVDLFVGVASVGNDPDWQDRGEAREFNDYWAAYAFGELGVSGESRHDLLERLLPKLAIAERCELTDRFLRVRGERTTYKIHLGSTNILMEPDDRYLCIVQGRATDVPDGVFLPFEGDRGLAIILSKAFMLANDTDIDDETIVSQIEARG